MWDFELKNNTVKSEASEDEIPLVNRKSTTLFPSAMLNIEIDSSKNVNFNYNKGITRPDYSRASSISAFINPFLEGSGNVNLLPTNTEEVTVNFQVKNKFPFHKLYAEEKSDVFHYCDTKKAPKMPYCP